MGAPTKLENQCYSVLIMTILSGCMIYRLSQNVLRRVSGHSRASRRRVAAAEIQDPVHRRVGLGAGFRQVVLQHQRLLLGVAEASGDGCRSTCRGSGRQHTRQPRPLHQDRPERVEMVVEAEIRVLEAEGMRETGTWSHTQSWIEVHLLSLMLSLLVNFAVPVSFFCFIFLSPYPPPRIYTHTHTHSLTHIYTYI